ncbi:MAG: hypothetical protein JW719_07395 [Pirellulales bacterium]|nr:hypothetical protein [Pirellulales bacterium]
MMAKQSAGPDRQQAVGSLQKKRPRRYFIRGSTTVSPGDKFAPAMPTDDSPTVMFVRDLLRPAANRAFAIEIGMANHQNDPVLQWMSFFPLSTFARRMNRGRQTG